VADERAPGSVPATDLHADELLGRHVLVVDDDGQVRQVLARLLQSYGADVETAPGGAQAMAKLDHGSYDALLLDLDMPGVTGLDVLLHVQRTAPAMPVLVVTGTFEAERIEGAAAVLAKPVDGSSLRRALADALRNAGNR
jgi:CheY-like chemotaxis protein